jgi:hypothetical protein
MLVVPYPQKWQLADAFVTYHPETVRDQLTDEMRLLLYALNQQVSFRCPGGAATCRYGAFEQATVGPCNAPRPNLWNVVEKAKWCPDARPDVSVAAVRS